MRSRSVRGRGSRGGVSGGSRWSSASLRTVVGPYGEKAPLVLGEAEAVPDSFLWHAIYRTRAGRLFDRLFNMWAKACCHVPCEMPPALAGISGGVCPHARNQGVLQAVLGSTGGNEENSGVRLRRDHWRGVSQRFLRQHLNFFS